MTSSKLDSPRRGLVPWLMTTAKECAGRESLDRAWEGPRSPSYLAPQCRQQHGWPWRGQHSAHMLRDSHKCLDVSLKLSHTALDLTALPGLLLSLLPYASLMLCPSDTIPAAQSLRRLAAEDVLTGTGHSWGWVKDGVSTQTIPCPGMARLGFRGDIGEGAFCAGLTGR